MGDIIPFPTVGQYTVQVEAAMKSYGYRDLVLTDAEMATIRQMFATRKSSWTCSVVLSDRRVSAFLAVGCGA
jgi:hypothetical protein